MTIFDEGPTPPDDDHGREPRDWEPRWPLVDVIGLGIVLTLLIFALCFSTRGVYR